MAYWHPNSGVQVCILGDAARPSLARYVKTSLFSQSPEIQTCTPEHCYVIPSLGAKKQKPEPEQTEFLSATLNYRAALALDLQPPKRGYMQRESLLCNRFTSTIFNAESGHFKILNMRCFWYFFKITVTLQCNSQFETILNNKEYAVVDAYGEEERAMGWYYYVEDKLQCPFQAKCIVKRKTSPLDEGEIVNVQAMAPEVECTHEIFVEIIWQERELAVPLSQLEAISANEKMLETIGDWHYWVARGYQY